MGLPELFRGASQGAALGAARAEAGHQEVGRAGVGLAGVGREEVGREGVGLGEVDHLEVGRQQKVENLVESGGWGGSEVKHGLLRFVIGSSR